MLNAGRGNGGGEEARRRGGRGEGKRGFFFLEGRGGVL